MDNNVKPSVNAAAMFFCEELTDSYVNGDSNAQEMLANHIKMLDDSELIDLAKYAANKIPGYAKIIAMILSEWEERFKT